MNIMFSVFNKVPRVLNLERITSEKHDVRKSLDFFFFCFSEFAAHMRHNQLSNVFQTSE